MFALRHSDINSLKSGFLYLSGQPYCKKSRSAKVKGRIINLILRNYLIDRYTVKKKKDPGFASQPWQTLKLKKIFVPTLY
jgi:hypothetical protein